MSGGHFEYLQYQLESVIDELERLILTNNTKDEYGYSREFPGEVIEKFVDAAKAVRSCKEMIHRVDYLVSGDDSVETFLSGWYKCK